MGVTLTNEMDCTEAQPQQKHSGQIKVSTEPFRLHAIEVSIQERKEDLKDQLQHTMTVSSTYAKRTEIVGCRWWYFILNETVRPFQRLGRCAENNSSGSEEGKKTDLEECLKQEVSVQTEGTMQKCFTVRNEYTHGRKKISGQHMHVK